LNAIHKGLELQATYQPLKKLNIEGMASMGDYRWQDNVIADVFNDEQEYQGTASVYAKDVHRGNTAMTTAFLGANYWLLPNLKVGADVFHAADIYAQFDVENRVSADSEGIDSWKMPHYQLVNANLRYNFDLLDFESTIYMNVNNVLDTEYISDAKDGEGHNARTAAVWYGWGRTWNIALKLRF
jgi:outer membrane receptor protein involved in Fe transport